MRMSNLTLEAEDVFDNVEIQNRTDISTWQQVYGRWIIISHYLNFAMCIINVVANVFLIYIILRFRRLQNRTNYYLMNFAITNTIYHAFVPAYIIITDYIVEMGFNLTGLFCFFYLIEESAAFTSFLFACTIALDWYLINYHEMFTHLHRTLYKFAIALVYSIGIVRYLVMILTLCLTITDKMVHFLHITYVISLIIVVTVNILKSRRKDMQDLHKTKNSLTIANVAVLSWLPLYVWKFLLYLDSGFYALRPFLHSTLFIPKLITHSNAIWMLYALGRIDKHFAMAYGRAFRRKLRNYENDDLDRDSEDEAMVEHQVNILPESIHSEADNYLAA